MSAPTAWVIAKTASQWTVRCPYCGREHQHGPGEGHRGAHCHFRSWKPREVALEAAGICKAGYIVKEPLEGDRPDDRQVELFEVRR